MAKILVAEDDAALSSMIAKWLKEDNHVADIANGGKDALHLLRCFSYDLLVLDWGLPDLEGIKVCTEYRQSGGKSPIIFLTGRNDLQSKEFGLDSGADDYLTKPFDSQELLARIRALLRRIAVDAPEKITVRGLCLDPRSRCANIDGKEVKLGAREFDLLKYLMQHPDQTFSSKALLRLVWPPDSALAEETVRSTMHSLRKKINQQDQAGIIETILGQGFIIRSTLDN